MHGFVSGVFLICGGHGCDFFLFKIFGGRWVCMEQKIESLCAFSIPGLNGAWSY